MDYSTVELKVESDMIRTELIPTPGQWWIQVQVDQAMTAKDGKCCLMSPQLFGLKASGMGYYFKQIEGQLGVCVDWIVGATEAFDGYSSRPCRWGEEGKAAYQAGHDFGWRMREKHVHE